MAHYDITDKHFHHSQHGMNPPMGHHGHDHHKMMVEDFKKRFFISGGLSIPVLILSQMIQMFFGFHISFAGDRYALFTLSTAIFIYGGWPFLKGVLDELGKKNPGMMTLIAMAITVAYVYSSATVFGLKGNDFFWELATLIDIMLVGHWIEMKSVMGASRSLEMLVSMMPSIAHKVYDGLVKEVKINELVLGDIILIKPGEKVAADGIVVEGDSYLNESMLTGESVPVRKVKESKVIGGSLNGNGILKIRVNNTGKDSYLSKVIAMVKEAQDSKSEMQNLSDKAARWLTIMAISAGLITLITWLAIGKDFSFALERMVTVMVISCPHALGLAVPLVVAISTAVAAQKGLLIRNRTAFEESRKITTIVFDKTGTLTKGQFGVTRYESLKEGLSTDELLGIAASLEKNSEHPIAIGIVNKAQQLKIPVKVISDFSAISGQGIEAKIDGKQVRIVSPGYLKEKDIRVPDVAHTESIATTVFVIIEKDLAGFISLADEIRPESYEAIQIFKANNIKVMMATGDNKAVAESVGKQLGLDGYYAEVLPHQKVEIIKQLQAKGEFVAMTGDGINDAPALAQADVGIAVGSGTDIAAETSDIVLVNSNPKDILNLVLFGKATYRKMIQNLTWATAYNSVSIPLAAGVLYSYGVMMSPAVGAVLMSLSTIIVAINAQLLRKKIS